jgi:hypothetical protein
MADNSILTNAIKDRNVTAEKLAAYQETDGTSAEVWVLDCGGAE